MKYIKIILLSVACLCVPHDLLAGGKKQKSTTQLSEVERRMRYLTDHNGLPARIQRVIENQQEIQQIHRFADQLGKKIEAFEIAVTHNSFQAEDKAELMKLHQQVLLPLPNIVTRFFCGRIINDIEKPNSYLSTQAIVRIFDQSQDLSDLHARLADAARSYKKRIQRRFPQHKRAEQSYWTEQEGDMLRQEYRECITPFIACVKVFADTQKNKPELLVQALFLWASLPGERDLPHA